ncbi:MAG: helix-turn-helix domain-containing protein [Promethearchaeia archaeon]
MTENIPDVEGNIDHKKALERLGLSSGEINAYFSVAGKGVCLMSEIAKHAHVEMDEAKTIVSKLIEKGLLKEIPGRTIRFQALPPYSALLNQLEAFRDYVAELRDEVPQQLENEFSRFEEGFARVSGLEDFKRFVTDVKDKIPQRLNKKFTELAQEFEKFEQIKDFEKYIGEIKNSAPMELSQKFEEFSKEFDNLKSIEEFKNFVSRIREKARTELKDRFDSLETEFTELRALEDLKGKFTEIKTTVPQKLRGSFSKFQEDFKDVAELTSFKDFVGDVKKSLPRKINAEFTQIENQFNQLQQLQDFENFVRDITAQVPKEMVQKFEGFENKFRSVSGLEEFKDFLTNLKRNVPQELEDEFQDFETAIKGIKSDILNTETQLMGNYQKIMGDIFNEFIDAFVSEVVMERVESLKEMFQEEVIKGVEEILGKVLLKTQTMSNEVLDSFDQLRKWLMEEVISGLKSSLEAVNQKVIEASKGVTDGFNRLKKWITQQVTQDLEKTLSEVESGAMEASQRVIGAIDTLQNWFDEKVIAGLEKILTNMEKKLGDVAQKASESLQDVEGWFVDDAIEGIEATLEETQNSVEQVTVEVQNSLDELESWFRGEAVNQLEEVLENIEGRIHGATKEVLTGFDEMKSWVSEDVIITIKDTLDDVTQKVRAASSEIDKEVQKLKTMFQGRVVENTFNMLSGIEDRLWESEATMKAFWDKALSEVAFRFQEVWFVQGADAMVGEISQIVGRVKSKLFIVAPRLEDIDFVPIRNLSHRINVRIAANIDPNSTEEMNILKEFIERTNFAFRHYPDENIWGVSKDMEEIILGAVSGFDVAGIGSVINEHIKNFNPVLERAWMKGTPIKSMDDAQMIQAKRAPRKIERDIAVTDTNIPAPSTTTQPSGEGDTESISPQYISEAFSEQKKEAAKEIKAKLENLNSFIKKNPTKGELGSKLNELKENIINSYGFSRLVFDISKISRDLLRDPKNVLSDSEIVKLKNSIKEWKEKL